MIWILPDEIKRNVCFHSSPYVLVHPTNHSRIIQHKLINSNTWHTVSSVMLTIPKAEVCFSRNDAAFTNTAVVFSPRRICIPTLCVAESRQGRRAEMNHVCPVGDCASSSAGAAAAAVYEHSWTELIGHMLPRQYFFCLLGLGRSKASLSE